MTTLLVPVDCHRCINRTACSDRRDGALFGCYDYCVGACDKTTCDFTCAFNEPLYSIRTAEVGGRGKIYCKSACGIEPLPPPLHLPLILGNSAREIPSRAPFVAVPFHSLFREIRRSSLEPIATSANDVRRLLGLNPTCRIAAIGVNFDNHLERMWEYHKVTDIAAAFRAMGITFATTPNFSFFVFAPRDHYEWNRRRTLLFATRLWEAGFPAVPHIYAESDASWLEWAEFFVEHPKLDAFAFELQTGDAPMSRIPELRRQLRLFSEKVGRPLHPVVSGASGANWFPQIFSQVTVVEANSYMKAVKRRKLTTASRGRLKEHAVSLADISGLLDDNIAATKVSLEIRSHIARDRTAKTEKDEAPIQKRTADANLWLSGFAEST